VANYGRAEKEVVQKRIKQILKLKEIPQPDDVADALGVALCGVFSVK
jgi:crossover junction endodeoxyribonuclease RuvC